MPTCPKCCAKLVKRKSTQSYNCKRHGWVRDIIPPYQTTPEEREIYRQNPILTKSRKRAAPMRALGLINQEN